MKLFVEYDYLKLEGLFLLKEPLEKRGRLLQACFKRDFFKYLFTRTQKNCKVPVERKTNFNHFFCLCFGLASTPADYTKLMKISFAILKR